MRLWIQDPRIIYQQWTPVSIQQGSGGNWWQHDVIQAVFSDCEHGRCVRVDWLCSGDPSAQVQRGSQKRQRPEAESSETSAIYGGAAPAKVSTQQRLQQPPRILDVLLQSGHLMHKLDFPFM